MNTVQFSFSGSVLVPNTPQHAGVQGDHQATAVVFTLPTAWIEADYLVRAEYIDGAGAFDTTPFLEVDSQTVTVPLPFAWTMAGGLAEIRLAAATTAGEGLPETVVTYSPVGYLYFDSRDGEPAVWRDFPGRGLSALIADCLAAADGADEAAATLLQQRDDGDFDGATWWFGTAVSGTGSAITATVAGARPGDAYFNVSAYTVYKMTGEDTWQYLGCVRGADGTSCTHSWSGTTLSVTSASGTSSANLKGDKGDPGNWMFAFAIDSAGHLQLTYEGEAAPDFYVNDDGHLCVDI